jgi:hypothetical protein
MRRLILIIVITIFTGCTLVKKAIIPEEILGYCKGIFHDEDMIQRCVDQELEAKERLSKMEIPHHIFRECRELSWSTGKSYQVLETCIVQFMDKNKK